MNYRFLIPNFLTSLNLLFGCLGCVLAFGQDLYPAFAALIIAAFFDFIDGQAARILNGKSNFGKQMDSLADLISFGLLPAIVMHSLFINSNRPTDITSIGVSFEISIDFLISLIPFLITLCVAYRLAKFNLISNNDSEFIGLPSPAIALLIVPLPLMAQKFDNDLFAFTFESVTSIIIITLISSFLVLMPLKMFKLKLSLNRKQSIAEWVLYLVALMCGIFYQELSIPLIIIVYILINLVVAIAPKVKRNGNYTLL